MSNAQALQQQAKELLDEAEKRLASAIVDRDEAAALVKDLREEVAELQRTYNAFTPRTRKPKAPQQSTIFDEDER